MASFTNLVSLMAAIPTMTSFRAPSVTNVASAALRECGEVNVFYTGFPPCHELVAAQGWDPVRVAAGLRNETVNLANAGYNVHAVFAGIEVPINLLEKRMHENGVKFDVTAIGYGMRGANLQPIVERFEDLVEMYERNAPEARKVFNYNPESLLWSVEHRVPLKEDCAAVGKPGKLIGYEEVGKDSSCLMGLDNPAGKVHKDEL
ncbi:Hypothetical protein PENO1_104760 [Penicillium occitanis (nom. inval.)]|nr:Hypothetical protein PENO1_104760 [Penicillium occitanis (nom. inval.)]PCG89741.1 hypothetical protein PENOC_105230 [Penicillium occitanis (nom. inval.)]